MGPFREAGLAHSQEENDAEEEEGWRNRINSFALLVVLGAAFQAMAKDATTPYPKMAPTDQHHQSLLLRHQL